jgi:arylsulfate sulfotransferase
MEAIEKEQNTVTRECLQTDRQTLQRSAGDVLKNSATRPGCGGMKCPSIKYWTVALSAVIGFLMISQCSYAVTILTGPVFTPATNAPLAGVLELTTDTRARVSVQVSDGTNRWRRDFYDYVTTHSVPLLGFKPDRTNSIQVTVFDAHQNASAAASPLLFVTAPLPGTFPKSVLLTNVPSMMEPGYTLFILQNRNSKTYVTIMDNSAEVVWYCPAPAGASDLDVRQLDDGNLFIPEQSPANDFLEINMLGQKVRTWSAPAGYKVDGHDGIPTDHGTILYLTDVTRTVSNFPSSTTVSNAPRQTVTMYDNPVVEISATNSTILHLWSSLNLLNPTRISYLTTYGSIVDNLHGNALIEDTNDNSIIVSLRNQNAVFKFSRAGLLQWILGPPANWGTDFQPYLLTPVGTPFEWNYGQHAPMLTPQGTLLVYDNGNFRASPFGPQVADKDNFSRGVEYSIDQTNRQVSQVWESRQANGDRLYTPIIGKAQWLPQRQNILVTYGYITYINGVHPSAYSANATMVRIIEYTHDPVPKAVFDLSFFDYANHSVTYYGNFVYRSLRIPDLYAHPARPVAGLWLTESNQLPVLKFSADPVRTYLVQASADLTNWTTIGPAVPSGDVGDYAFEDICAGQYAARFYRVVTQ